MTLNCLFLAIGVLIISFGTGLVQLESYFKPIAWSLNDLSINLIVENASTCLITWKDSSFNNDIDINLPVVVRVEPFQHLDIQYLHNRAVINDLSPALTYSIFLLKESIFSFETEQRNVQTNLPNLPPNFAFKNNDGALADNSRLYISERVIIEIDQQSTTTRSIANNSIITWRISPNLPRGLSINETTGYIYGIPLELLQETSYVVSAENIRGKSESNLIISVVDRPPPLFICEPSRIEVEQFDVENHSPILSAIYFEDSDIYYSGGLTYIFTINPPLPEGLFLDTHTGMIMGNPVGFTSGNELFRVTASNSGGEQTFEININIPSILEYEFMEIVYIEGQDVAPNRIIHRGGGGGITSSGGGSANSNINSNDRNSTLNLIFLENTKSQQSFIRFRISPPLPPGLIFNALSGMISGSPYSSYKRFRSYRIEAYDITSNVLYGISEIQIKVNKASIVYWRGVNCGGTTTSNTNDTNIHHSNNNLLSVNSSRTSRLSNWKDDIHFLVDRDVLHNYYDASLSDRYYNTPLSMLGGLDRSLDPHVPIDILRSLRFSKSILMYKLPAKLSGFWKIRFHFIEMDENFRTKNREMNIFINNQLYETGFDILSHSLGVTNRAIYIDKVVLVTSGSLRIRLEGSKGVSICAIEYGPILRLNTLMKTFPLDEVIQLGYVDQYDPTNFIDSIEITLKIAKPHIPVNIREMNVICIKGGCDGDTIITNSFEIEFVDSYSIMNDRQPMIKLRIQYLGNASLDGKFTIYISGENFYPITIEAMFTHTKPVFTHLPPGFIGYPKLQKLVGKSKKAVQFKWYKGVVPIKNPTSLAWGPDHRLYAASMSGSIYIYEISQDGTFLIEKDVVNVNAKEILDINFNPFVGDKELALYIAHNEKLYAAGGSCYTGKDMQYPGKISTLTFSVASNQWVEKVIVENLPVSNHDHGVNDIIFDKNGDLLIAIGGNTNAGVSGNCKMGALPESPLSGAIIRIPISSDFDVNTHTYQHKLRSIQYFNPSNELEMSAWKGGDVVFKVGETGNNKNNDVLIDIYSPGHRNAFGCVFTPLGEIYCTDNGPNKSFGPYSTGLNSNGGSITVGNDELNRILPYSYYGFPNRNRAKYINSQNQAIWYNAKAKDIKDYKAPITLLPSSQGGLDVYTAWSFNGALKGALMCQKYKGGITVVKLDQNDADKVLGKEILYGSEDIDGLDVLHAPGGLLLVAAFTSNQLSIGVPMEDKNSLKIFDVFPWRTPFTGGQKFVISGQNFGPVNQIFIQDQIIEIISQSSNKIYAVFPPGKPDSGSDLIDITLISWFSLQNGIKITISKAFMYV